LQGNGAPPHLEIKKKLFEVNKMIDDFKEYQMKIINNISEEENNIYWMSGCRLLEQKFSYRPKKCDLERP
jgi:hypothetical protein